MVFKVSNRFALTKQILHNKAIPQIAENHSIMSQPPQTNHFWKGVQLACFPCHILT